MHNVHSCPYVYTVCRNATVQQHHAHAVYIIYTLLNVGNCLKSPKMDKKTYIVLYQVAEIFRNMNFLQLMKHILNIIFSRFGGLIQHLWVSPLWLSALQLLYTILYPTYYDLVHSCKLALTFHNYYYTM